MLDSIKSIIAEQKRAVEQEIEGERQRVIAIQLEKDRQQTIQDEHTLSERPKEYDRLIDKPLGNQKLLKPKDTKKSTQPFLSPRGEIEEEVEDDEDNLKYHRY